MKTRSVIFALLSVAVWTTSSYADGNCRLQASVVSSDDVSIFVPSDASSAIGFESCYLNDGQIVSQQKVALVIQGEPMAIGAAVTDDLRPYIQNVQYYDEDDDYDVDSDYYYCDRSDPLFYTYRSECVYRDGVFVIPGLIWRRFDHRGFAGRRFEFRGGRSGMTREFRGGGERGGVTREFRGGEMRGGFRGGAGVGAGAGMRGGGPAGGNRGGGAGMGGHGGGGHR
jgi:hypothetical protein